MAHEKAETVAEHGANVYRIETRRERASGAVVARLYELHRERGGMVSWSLFGGWSAVLATGGQRATTGAIETTHARARAFAPAAIAERRARLAQREAEIAAGTCRHYAGQGHPAGTCCETCRTD